jgi:molybdate transport system permease protein
MNRLFDTIIWGIGALLIIAFLSLFAGMLAELVQGEVLSSPDMHRVWFAIRLSLFTATIASIVAIIVSIPVAYLFSRHNFLFKNFFDTLLDLPIVLSPIALGAMLLIFFNTPVGRQINALFGPFVFEVKGIILAQFFVVVGLSVRLLKVTFEGIDVEYENLARTLGYGKLRVFFHVLMPLARKGVISALLLSWGKAMGEFGATVTLAGATTLKTETIPVAISLSFESVDITNALIFITILVVISFAILFFVRSFQGIKI